jgi:lipoyl(octanoyl) transferase
MGVRQNEIEIKRFGTLRYSQGLRLQQEYRDKLGRGGNGYLLLLEHYPVITNGRFAGDSNFSLTQKLIEEMGVEIHKTDRGGDLTYHGPGQLVAYPIIPLREFKLRPREYINLLEETLIRTLWSYGIDALRKPGYPGVWVHNTSSERAAKIASIGVRVKNGITSHGCALNVNTELSYFSLIVPCGIPGVEITSMNKLLGNEVEVAKVADTFSRVFTELLGSRAGLHGPREEKLAARA